jgi:perosamine synthetase
MKIQVASPLFGGNEEKYVMDALRKGDISGMAGEYLPRFEREFSSYIGVPYGLAVSNGTTALHLAIATFGIGKGDEVLVASLTNMASFFSVLYEGATPVPIDIESDTLNIDPEKIEQNITARTKAIMVVHLFGHPVDMDPIMEIADRRGLFVIEDCAQAHGAEYKGRKVGTFGHAACFSFYANKIITTGEGGMVLFKNRADYELARSLKSLSYGTKERFMHEAIGFNYRMTNLTAAIGCAQLEKIEDVLAIKRSIAALYISEFSHIHSLHLPVEKPYAKNVYWMFHIVLDGEWEGRRSEFRARLKEEGIDTRESFVPGNKQKVLEGKIRNTDCPEADFVGKNGFYLPSGPIIQESEIRYVCEKIRKILD